MDSKVTNLKSDKVLIVAPRKLSENGLTFRNKRIFKLFTKMRLDIRIPVLVNGEIRMRKLSREGVIVEVKKASDKGGFDYTAYISGGVFSASSI